jgi:hypothetical protein
MTTWLFPSVSIILLALSCSLSLISHLRACQDRFQGLPGQGHVRRDPCHTAQLPARVLFALCRCLSVCCLSLLSLSLSMYLSLGVSLYLSLSLSFSLSLSLAVCLCLWSVSVSASVYVSVSLLPSLVLLFVPSSICKHHREAHGDESAAFKSYFAGCLAYTEEVRKDFRLFVSSVLFT